MQQESMMLYKLIALYILGRADYPMTNSDLSSFFTDKQFTNYFQAQQAISDLVEAGYAEIKTTYNTTMYSITPVGRETLPLFINDISALIRDDVDNYLEEKKYAVRDQLACAADYFEKGKNEYVAVLKITEGNSELISINLSVTSPSEADTICNHWKELNVDLYGTIISSLITGNKPH